MFAKLVDGQLKIADKLIKYNNRYIVNPPAEVLIAAGFYFVEETPRPDEVDGYYWRSYYTQEEDKILQNWEMLEIPKVTESRSERFFNVLDGEI